VSISPAQMRIIDDVYELENFTEKSSQLAGTCGV
jgi:hypothetical protein